jgi:hypothetical protein
MSSGNTGAVSYATDIKALFREKDQESMQSAFDLWNYDDVSANADAILAAVKAGKMPCDGAWPVDKVQAFQSWVDAGKPA